MTDYDKAWTAQITKLAQTQGNVDATNDKPCDPRGAFIRCPAIEEEHWLLFRKAYDQGYDDTIAFWRKLDSRSDVRTNATSVPELPDSIERALTK